MYWFSKKKENVTPVTGLILPGGGARNAYQVGVLKAIKDLLPDDAENPFPVICGTSSGAFNAAFLASNANHFSDGIANLVGFWENFESRKVFLTDWWSAVKSGSRWASSLLTASFGTRAPRSLLNNKPLRGLLESHIRFARIQQAIDSGALRAFSVTASGYSSGSSVSYFQGVEELENWQRNRRRGARTEIGINHLMASGAIPLIFPAVWMNDEYQGDGAMRESAPLSPALHLGANRLLIIGVRNPTPDTPSAARPRPPYPSIGQITGYMLDTLFMDRLDSDIERMNRINHIISQTPEKHVEHGDSALRPIDFLMISPSEDIRDIAQRHTRDFPRSVRLLLKGLGALSHEGRPLISYLLFEAGFCRELIELGYRDGMKAKEQLIEFLKLENPA